MQSTAVNKVTNFVSGRWRESGLVAGTLIVVCALGVVELTAWTVPAEAMPKRSALRQLTEPRHINVDAVRAEHSEQVRAENKSTRQPMPKWLLEADEEESLGWGFASSVSVSSKSKVGQSASISASGRSKVGQSAEYVKLLAQEPLETVKSAWPNLSSRERTLLWDKLLPIQRDQLLQSQDAVHRWQTVMEIESSEDIRMKLGSLDQVAIEAVFGPLTTYDPTKLEAAVEAHHSQRTFGRFEGLRTTSESDFEGLEMTSESGISMEFVRAKFGGIVLHKTFMKEVISPAIQVVEREMKKIVVNPTEERPNASFEFELKQLSPARRSIEEKIVVADRQGAAPRKQYVLADMPLERLKESVSEPSADRRSKSSKKAQELHDIGFEVGGGSRGGEVRARVWARSQSGESLLDQPGSSPNFQASKEDAEESLEAKRSLPEVSKPKTVSNEEGNYILPTFSSELRRQKALRKFHSSSLAVDLRRDTLTVNKLKDSVSQDFSWEESDRVSVEYGPLGDELQYNLTHSHRGTVARSVLSSQQRLWRRRSDVSKPVERELEKSCAAEQRRASFDFSPTASFPSPVLDTVLPQRSPQKQSETTRYLNHATEQNSALEQVGQEIYLDDIAEALPQLN